MLGCRDRFPHGYPSPSPAPGLAVSQSVCLSCEPHAPLPTLSQGITWEQRPQYIVCTNVWGQDGTSSPETRSSRGSLGADHTLGVCL